MKNHEYNQHQKEERVQIWQVLEEYVWTQTILTETFFKIKSYLLF